MVPSRLGRRLRRATALALAAASLAAGATSAQMPKHNRHFLVGADWLATHIDSAVVIHVGRSDSSFRAAHVPGARFLPLAAVAVAVNGVPNEFPPLVQVAAAFEAVGIPPAARIVLYGDDAGLLAARAWAALDVIGHADRAALLDGGLAAWLAAGRPVESGAGPRVAPRPIEVRAEPGKVVDAEWVRGHLSDSTVLFVDARPAAYFEGTEDCPVERSGCLPEGRRGHIPGAVSIFWMQALAGGDVRTTRSMHELHHDLWTPAGTGRPGLRTIVVYCGSGMQASHGYWQARYIGYPDVRLYDGSMSEWAGLPADRFPVTAGK